MKKRLILATLLISRLAVAQSPGANPTLTDSSAAGRATPTAEKNELRYNLNASGSRYFRVTFLNQTWLRLNQSNPGTTVIGEPKANTFDIGLRRTRMQLYGQISDNLFVYFQYGLNNFNFLNAFPAYNTNGTPSNRKVQAFMHDAVGEYIVFRGKNYLKIGGGLTVVNGLSRFSQPSVGTILSLDVPVFAQATVDQTDEFSRKLSLYARGQIGPIDYRLAISDPFPIATNGATPPALSTNSNFALLRHNKQFQGYFLYNIFDKEDHTLPGYMSGTYLGKKKVFNIEAGFITQKAAMWHREGVDTVYQAMKLWSVASFLDMPTNTTTGAAINAYLGYFHTDYGKDYLRFNGIMNPANGTSQAISGVSGTQGNAFPMFGTGSVIYAQVGYLFRRDLLGANGTLLPYGQAQIASYDRIAKTLGIYNVGLNWMIRGHNGKLTLDYQNRPYYNQTVTNNQLSQQGRRGQLTLQYQLFI